MTYSLDFDYVTLVICIMLIYLYFVRSRFKDVTDITFISMTIMLLMVTALDIATALIAENPGVLPDAVDYQINIAFLVATGLLPIPCFVYVFILTTGRPPRPQTYLLFLGVGLVSTLLVVTTPLTHWIIYIENGVYAHGPYFDLFYLLLVFYLLFFVRLFLKKSIKLTSAQGFAVGFFMLFSSVVIVIQTTHPSILLMGLAAGVFVMSMYLTAQNPDAYIERVTGCYNAAAFRRVMQQEFFVGRSGCIIVLSLRDFDSINQTYGRSTGDAVIGDMAAFLTGASGQRNVFRLFDCDYLVRVDDEDEVSSIVSATKDRYRRAVTVNGVDLFISPYFLVIPYPDVIGEADDIADVISYYLSRPVAFDADRLVRAGADYLDARLREDAVKQAIQLAIGQRSFEPFFQPIYNARTRRIDSAEVLIRLNDPQLGFIPPDEFIALAERTGSIVAVDGILFEKVLAFISENHIERYGIEYLESNLSMVECVQSGFAEHLLERMAHYGVSPQMLSFEITETAPSDCDDALNHMMDTLIAADSSFALDDYGTGFASSSYLLRYRFRLVKLDKTILWGALDDGVGLKVLEHTVSLLHELGYEIVAEGVETEEQLELLLGLGVDRMQGYHIARPMDQDAFLDTIKGC